MPLFPGPRYDGVASIVQAILLRAAFLMQDVGEWLRVNGRRFEDWVCPSGRQPREEPAEFWSIP